MKGSGNNGCAKEVCASDKKKNAAGVACVAADYVAFFVWRAE